MAATSTILFPEAVSPYPAEGGYDSSPQPDQLAFVQTDSGAEQVRKKRTVLMQFRYRTVPINTANLETMDAFVLACGAGDVNFTFYEPYSARHSELMVGLTDGTASMIVGWRGINSWSDFLIDGSSLNSDLSHDFEFVDPTKEDRINLLTVTPPAGQEMVFEDPYARKRYICRMESWRRYAYRGGAIPAELFDPSAPTTLPLFRMVYEFQFREKV